MRRITGDVRIVSLYAVFCDCQIAREGKAKIIALSATPQKAREHFGDLCWNVPFDSSCLISYETASTETYASAQSLLLQVRGKTGILYTERIESMKKLISFAREQGIRADGFWSIREETQAKHPMSEEQFALRKAVLEQETIPENIDLLVINASSETCIKIQGEKRKVDYMIIHTTNEETQTQVRGRYCGDLPKLYLHSTTLNPMEIVVPANFLGRNLFDEDKKALCRTLNLTNPKGGYYKWAKVCSLLPTVHIVEIAVSPFAVVIGISASGIIDEVHIGFFSYGCKGCRCPNAHKSSKAHNRRQHKRDGFLEFCFNHCVFLPEMQKRTDVTQCVRLKLFCFSSSRYRCCTPYRIAFLPISTQR